jgi:hypothetical protein
MFNFIFTQIGVVESLYAIKNKSFRRFSEQNLVDCTLNQYNSNTGKTNLGCNGGWPETAFDYIKNFGVVEEASYPYRQRVSVLFHLKLHGSLLFLIKNKFVIKRKALVNRVKWLICLNLK